MNKEIKVLRESDLDSVLTFEKTKLEQTIENEVEREFASWHARWRQEALEHYLPLGWSFGLWSQDLTTLHGYFLGQPLLYFRGLAQTLWIEHLRADEEADKALLVEVAYRTSRDKHLQNVIFSSPESYMGHLELWKPQKIDETLIQVKTAKF